MHTQPKVVIYTKGICESCRKAKALLELKKVEFEVIDISEQKGEDPLRFLQKHTKCNTVPQIFIGNIRVGGFDKLKAYQDNGKLDELLGIDRE